MDLAHHFLSNIQDNYLNLKNTGERTLAQIQDESHYTWTPNEEVNSIATLIQHLHGNMMSRWNNFLISDGEKKYRKRDQEFEQPNKITQEDLFKLWNEGWKCTLDAINSLKTSDLLKNITIRGENHTVIEALNRQLTHYSAHIGQMVHITKTLNSETWNSLSIPRKK